MVVDSIDAGTLAASAGFVADGSRYVALLRNQPPPGTPEARFLEWVQARADETLARTRSWR